MLDKFDIHFNKACTSFKNDNTFSGTHNETADDSLMDLDDNGRSIMSNSEDKEKH